MLKLILMIRALIILAACALAWPAAAQTPPPLDAQKYVENLRAQRNEAAERAANLEAEYPAAIAVFTKRAAELEAYLKACGDKAGCTVPADETK